MNRSSRHAFTLVELLVVITIIGMLMSLLMPAVQNAREAGRRTQCLNNQRQLTTALMNYESAKKRLPGYLNPLAPSTLAINDGVVSADTDAIPVSWVVLLLPYLDRNDLWSVWREQDPYAPTLDAGGTVSGRLGYSLLQLLSCPSNPQSIRTKGDTSLAYRVNCGHRDAHVIDVSPASGVFFDQYHPTDAGGAPITPVRTSLDYVSQHDGTSTTLLLSEIAESIEYTQSPLVDTGYAGIAEVNARWTLPDNGTTAEYPDPDSDFVQDNLAELGLGFTVSENTVVDQAATTFWDYLYRINQYVGDNQQTGGNNGVISAFHNGVVVVSFCDGRQSVLDDSMDKLVYLHLITPFGKKAADPARDNLSGFLPLWELQDGSQTPPLDEADL